LFYTNPRFK